MRLWPLLTAVFLALPLSATVTFDLTPQGALTGLPGTEVGWGFVITNDTGYIEITAAEFCLNPVSPDCKPDPAQGSFNDIISTDNDIIVGPPGGTLPSSVSQDFDPVALTGVGSFDISPSATLSAADVGQIILTYNICDADPNAGGNCFSIGTVEADASVTVEGGVPEPASAGIVCVALGAMLLLRRRSTLKRGSTP